MNSFLNRGDLSAFFGYPAEGDPRSWHDWELGNTDTDSHSNDIRDFQGKLEVDADWPQPQPELGQIGGVAVDGDNNPHIFHRADRIWEEEYVYWTLV